MTYEVGFQMSKHIGCRYYWRNPGDFSRKTSEVQPWRDGKSRRLLDVELRDSFATATFEGIKGAWNYSAGTFVLAEQQDLFETVETPPVGAPECSLPS